MPIGHDTALRLLHAACPPPSLVVDAGAFPGGLTRRMRADGWSVIALDKAPDRGQFAQEAFDGRASAQGDSFAAVMAAIGVEVRAADLELDPYPLADGSVDAVVLTEVIEHLWVDPLHALFEINRILRPGGTLIVSTPNFTSLRRRLAFLRGAMPQVIEAPLQAYVKKLRLGHVGHVRLYAPDELCALLGAVGFTCRREFFPWDYWATGDPVSIAGAAAVVAAPPVVTRRRWKSPRALLRAVGATLTAHLEARVPPWRSHLFLIATKTRSVDAGSIAA